MHRTTEQDSNHHNLEQMNVLDILNNINKEDKTVAFSVEKAIPKQVKTINLIFLL